MGETRAVGRLDYNHAFAAAAAAHEAVMGPARADYNREIAVARSLGKDSRITPEALAAWRDAYDRAMAEYRQVLASHGFAGKGERLA